MNSLHAFRAHHTPKREAKFGLFFLIMFLDPKNTLTILGIRSSHKKRKKKKVKVENKERKLIHQPTKTKVLQGFSRQTFTFLLQQIKRIGISQGKMNNILLNLVIV